MEKPNDSTDYRASGCCIERLYRRTLFRKRLSESQWGEKNVEYVDRTETRFFRQLARFPNVERFLERF